jgi:hypothetical protein
MSADTKLHRPCAGCGERLEWGCSNAQILSYLARVGWRFVLVTCLNCGALTHLEMLVGIDRAEQLGCADDRISGQPPTRIEEMARMAELVVTSMGGMSLNGRNLPGVNLDLCTRGGTSAATTEEERLLAAWVSDTDLSPLAA